MTATEQFAEFVRHHAIKAGYDLSGPRSGGRKALAEDTGICHASICRMLNGQTIPVAESLESLAEAVDISVSHLLELAGVVSPGALTDGPLPEIKPLTAKEAAARLGIRQPLRVALLEAVVATLLTDQEATP
jgi:transcriptional regulator with XRE-family HTH domain